MQRLYSMFPEGWPGVGLLLLRLSLALHCGLPVLDAARASSLLATAMGTLAACVALGLFTPIAVVAIVAVEGFDALAGPVLPAPSGLPQWLLCIAIALLGPGAWSLDAVWFGRRRVDIPPCDD